MNQKPILGNQINFAHSLAQGLVGYWLMNEGCGDKIYDLSGSGNTGTISEFSSTSIWNPGRSGICLNFDGDYGYISNIFGSKLNIGDGSFSMGGWVKPEYDVNPALFFTDNYDFYFYIPGTNKWSLYTADYGDTVSSTTEVVWDAWQHIYIVFSSSTGILNFYINGVLDASISGFSSTTLDGAACVMCAPFNGSISEFSIYNRSLTSLEIMELYYKPYAMFECLDLLSFLTSGESETTTYFIGGMRNRQQKPILGEKINFAHPLAQGLVACWIMNEGCGNKIYDLSENRNVGTLSNASWTLYENGSALDFNDTNSSVEIEDNDNLDGYAEMSWSFWVIPRDIAEDTVGFVTKYDAVNGKRSWAVRQAETNNEIQLFISGDGTTFAHVESSGFNLIDDALTHIVVVKKGTVGYFYKNGQFISSAGGLASIIYAGSEGVAIGRYRAVFFDGLIDNVQIYNRALTPDEAQQLYYEPYAMFEHIVTYLFGEAAPSVNRRRRLLIAGGCR